jgi:hypothetical protein
MLGKLRDVVLAGSGGETGGGRQEAWFGPYPPPHLPKLNIPCPSSVKGPGQDSKMIQDSRDKPVDVVPPVMKGPQWQCCKSL